MSDTSISFPVEPIEDRFAIESMLGEGAVGVVYAARDLERGTKVAIKVLRLVSAEHVRLMKREFRLVQDIVHPNLVRLLELIQRGGHWYLVMERVEGEDLLRHIAGPGGAEGKDGEAWRFDERRLRAAMGALAAGLLALHGAGKVHRDVKPSNVRVAADGRVVLLDFGLVRDVHEGTEEGITGTVSHMAPEQAAGEEVGPAADAYALGVILFQALTGRLPFEGTSGEMLEQKLLKTAPAVSELGQAVPADLVTLTARLLEGDPARRATLEDVLAIAVDATGKRAALVADATFVGRREELATLRRAFDGARAGASRAVIVRGPSGIGKSGLTRAFVADLRSSHDDVLALEGRCYERESVPYKAIDALVDPLAEWLVGESREVVESLLPVDMAMLAEVFPVLRRSPAIAALRVGSLSGADPHMRRARVFRAFHDLVHTIAERRRLVLVVDDLQWADADSLALLRETLDNTGRSGFLLVATERLAAREDDRDASAGERALGAEVLPVAGLSPADAETFARELMGEGLDASQLARVLEDAKGSPMFLDELARHSRTFPRGGTTPLLDDALWLRALTLDDATRRVLEAVCVAGIPTPERVCAIATQLGPVATSDAVERLRGERLVRTSGASAGATVEPYHDRVRESVVAHLDASTRVSWHGRIASALESDAHASPEALFHHWSAAGDTARAVRHGTAAGEHAMRAFAFARAADLYQRVLGMADAGRTTQAPLLRALGDALTQAGRGAEAADAYQRAAAAIPLEEGVELRRLAAEQLLYAGHVDEGLARLRGVMEEAGVPLASTPLRALLLSIVLRLWLYSRGLPFQLASAEKRVDADFTRIDVCWSAAVCLSLIDTVTASEFACRQLLAARRAGSAAHLSRALTLEAGLVGALGGVWRGVAHKFVARARALAEEASRPDLVAFAEGGTGFVNYFNGEWRGALESIDRCLALYDEYGMGDRWVRDTATFWGGWTLVQLGDFRELARRLPGWLKDAEERRSLYLLANLQGGETSLFWLAVEGGIAARARRDAPRARWGRPPITVQHLVGLWGDTQVDLYAGDPERALSRLAEGTAATRRAMLYMRMPYIRVRLAYLWGVAHLAHAQSSATDARRHVGEARARARALWRENLPHAPALSQLLAGCVLAHQKRDVLARAALDDAVARFASAGMNVHGLVARLRLASLDASESGARAEAQAKADLRAQGVMDVERFAATLAPWSRRDRAVAVARAPGSESEGSPRAAASR
jgi:tetratricopeptide (TPR) repeat protein